MAAGRIRDGVPVSAIKDCKCIARSRGHFHLKEASAMELRGRTKLSLNNLWCDSAVEGRDRESEVEHSDTTRPGFGMRYGSGFASVTSAIK